MIVGVQLKPDGTPILQDFESCIIERRDIEGALKVGQYNLKKLTGRMFLTTEQIVYVFSYQDSPRAVAMAFDNINSLRLEKKVLQALGPAVYESVHDPEACLHLTLNPKQDEQMISYVFALRYQAQQSSSSRRLSA